MDFSCSPLWCNLYLFSYEIKFIQRLVTRLDKIEIRSKFTYAFRYIDDLFWLNMSEANMFLDPLQPRIMDHSTLLKSKLRCLSFQLFTQVLHQNTNHEYLG